MGSVVAEKGCLSARGIGGEARKRKANHEEDSEEAKVIDAESTDNVWGCLRAVDWEEQLRGRRRRLVQASMPVQPAPNPAARPGSWWTQDRCCSLMNTDGSGIRFSVQKCAEACCDPCGLDSTQKEAPGSSTRAQRTQAPAAATNALQESARECVG